jgi:predicted nucleic acid-binding protein
MSVQACSQLDLYGAVLLHEMRGRDAVYADVALRFGAELVTLDKEQMKRLRKLLPVKTP